MRFLPALQNHHWLNFVATAVLVAATGCSGSSAPVELIDVSGQVTQGSTPLANAMVELVPEGKGMGPSYATTGPDGVFVLRYVDGRDGACPGKHRVVITTGGDGPMGTGGDGPPPTTAPAPPKEYRAQAVVSLDNPVLTFDVSSM